MMFRKNIFSSAKYSDIPEEIRVDVDKLLDPENNAKYGVTYVIDNDKKKSSLYFYGPTGSGKTHLVHAIRKRVNELFPGGYAMTILNYTELQSMKIEEIMDLADSPHIVAIDDLGARSPSEYSIDVLYRLLNRRYEYMLPTIITSNLPTEKLTDIFGDRISSRIDRMSIPHEVS